MLLLGFGAAPLRAQRPPAPADSIPVHSHAIRWYEAAVVVGAVAALAPADEPVERWFQSHRSGTTNDLADGFRRVGQPEVWASVALGTIAVGLLAHRPPVTRAGLRITAGLGLAGSAALVLKELAGRSRPAAGKGAFAFHPFSPETDSQGNEVGASLPSGHTTMAFALAAGVADEVPGTAVHVALYVMATGTALSRLNDDKHWLSDTALGAAIGITGARLASGRWSVFGIRPPHFLIGPDGSAALGWSGAL